MLSALKAELAAKKRQAQEQTVMAGARKYMRRGELEAIERDQQTGEEKKQSPEKPRAEDYSNSSAHYEQMDQGPQLPRHDVIRRLRERGEPVTVFGESCDEALKRLRRLEIEEPEMNRGFRNDFQEALESVDRDYLNEIIKNSIKDTAKNVDLLAQEEQLTIEDIKRLVAESLQHENKNVEANCKVVYQFIQLILQIWGSRLNMRPEAEKMSVKGKLDSATYTQTHCYLKPLTKRLKKRSLPEDIMESLTEIVLFCLDKDYVKANDSYLQMAIGNAPWPIGVTMVGIHARTGREKIYSKHVAHVLNDETQRKYIQGLKRLITKCQTYFEAAPSKCVEYQATAQT